MMIVVASTLRRLTRSPSMPKKKPPTGRTRNAQPASGIEDIASRAKSNAPPGRSYLKGRKGNHASARLHRHRLQLQSNA